MKIEDKQCYRILEAVLFASDKPLSVKELRQCFPQDEQPEPAQVKSILKELQTEYAERGVQLNQVASGYCFRISADLGPWVGRLWEQKPPRYSRALMETLAVIAYRQPVTRGDIEQIRGVAVSSNIIKTLLDREWIRAVGQRDVPGRPELFATTADFLDYFGLQNLEALPTLMPLKELGADPQSDLPELEQTATAAQASLALGSEADENTPALAVEDEVTAQPVEMDDVAEGADIVEALEQAQAEQTELETKTAQASELSITAASEGG